MYPAGLNFIKLVFILVLLKPNSVKIVLFFYGNEKQLKSFS